MNVGHRASSAMRLSGRKRGPEGDVWGWTGSSALKLNSHVVTQLTVIANGRR